jgi:hypothetical protein
MNRISMFLLAASVAAAVPFVAGCQSTEVSTQPKQVVYQGYEYFPNSEVYFSHQSNTYFWHTPSGGWAQGPQLPAKYHIENEPSVSLQLSTDKPYERHPEIHLIYPPNQPFVVEDR